MDKNNTVNPDRPYDGRFLPSSILDIQPDGRRSFLADFTVLDDLERLRAVSKKIYTHFCPDGKIRGFRYIVVGHDADYTAEEIEGFEGEAVPADSLELALVPAMEYLRDYVVIDLGVDASEADLLEERCAECLTLGTIRYPAICLDDTRGSYVDPKSGHTVMWPLQILDDFAGCIPWYEARFDNLVRNPGLIGRTAWDDLARLV